MEELKKQYETILSERKKILDKINELKNNEFIKEYLILIEENIKLEEKLKEAYLKYKNKEYKECNHIWINTNIDIDNKKDLSTRGCVKCGLIESIADLNPDQLSFKYKTMFNFITENNESLKKGIKTSLLCNFETAQDIYNKLKNLYPNLEDDKIIKYLEQEIEAWYLNKYKEKKGKRK